MEEEEEYEITWVANDLDFCHQRKVLKKRVSPEDASKLGH